MTDYSVLVRFLRFFAGRTDRETAEVAAMMEELDRIAGILEAGQGSFVVAAERLRLAGRALAGVAGFLQQHILPEAVAAGNKAGEAQVRWVIDTCMGAMANLTTHAELTKDGEDFTVTLPPPP